MKKNKEMFSFGKIGKWLDLIFIIRQPSLSNFPLNKTFLCSVLLTWLVSYVAVGQSYSTYSSINDLMAADNSQYATVTRVSGTTGYTGFWFFGCFLNYLPITVTSCLIFENKDSTTNRLAV